MNIQQKLCPQCHTAAALDAAFCAACGRQYRTKFAAPNQTQIFTVAGGAVMPPQAASAPLMDELAAQYKRQFHWVCLCFFLFGITVIGIIFGFVILSRIEDIRMKVADLGISVSQWETPLRDWARRTVGYYALGFLGIPAALFLAIWLFLLLTAAVVVSTDSARTDASNHSAPVDRSFSVPNNLDYRGQSPPDYSHQDGISYGSSPPVIPAYPGQSTHPPAAPKAGAPRSFSSGGAVPARPAQPTIIDHNPAPSSGLGGGNPFSGSHPGRGGGF